MNHYTQLTEVQRYQIYTMIKAGYHQSAIANELEVHKSTISREITRNRGLRGYRPKQAHQLSLSRRRNKKPVRVVESHWSEIERLIKLYWSPEQISHRLFTEQGYCISPEWIYQYIYRDKAHGGTLYRYLRCQKQRKKRYGHYDKRGTLVNQTWIDERPECVEDRERIGDWEGDTIVGARHKGVLVSLVERKSRYTVLGHSLSKTMNEVGNQIIIRLNELKGKVKTMTYDNGREFGDHERIAKQLNTQIYFAHPYRSWERGTNENTNGLIRQFFPKSRSLIQVEEDEIQSTQDRLNHRPRKCLNYKTPHEVFYNSKETLTVALNS
jgi:IS30 family transposase